MKTEISEVRYSVQADGTISFYFPDEITTLTEIGDLLQIRKPHSYVELCRYFPRLNLVTNVDHQANVTVIHTLPSPLEKNRHFNLLFLTKPGLDRFSSAYGGPLIFGLGDNQSVFLSTPSDHVALKIRRH